MNKQDLLQETLAARGRADDAIKSVGNPNINRNIVSTVKQIIAACTALFNFKSPRADAGPGRLKMSDDINAAVLNAQNLSADELEFNIAAVEKEHLRMARQVVQQVIQMFPVTDEGVKDSVPEKVEYRVSDVETPKSGNEVELLLLDVENMWRTMYNDTVRVKEHKEFQFYRDSVISTLLSDVRDVYIEKLGVLRGHLEKLDTGPSMNG